MIDVQPSLTLPIAPLSLALGIQPSPKGSTLALAHRRGLALNARAGVPPFFSLRGGRRWVLVLVLVLPLRGFHRRQPQRRSACGTFPLRAPAHRQSTTHSAPLDGYHSTPIFSLFPLLPFYLSSRSPSFLDLDRVAPVDLWKHCHRRRVHPTRVSLCVHTGLHCPPSTCPRLVARPQPRPLALRLPGPFPSFLGQFSAAHLLRQWDTPTASPRIPPSSRRHSRCNVNLPVV